MQHARLLAKAALSLLAPPLLMLSGCGGNTPAAPESGDFRVVNGITDATSLTAAISNVATDTRNIQHDVGSPLTVVPDGTYSVTFAADSGREFSESLTEAGDDMLTTYVSYGVLANTTQAAFPVVESLLPPTSGDVVVQPVFAAYTEQQSLPSDTFGFSFQSTTTPAEAATGVSTAFAETVPTVSLKADKYRITIVASPTCTAGSSSCTTNLMLVFDSGPNGISLPSTAPANIVQVIAVDATSAQMTAYSSDVVLLLIDNLGNSTPLYNGQN